jgi:hypothetical protein
MLAIFPIAKVCVDRLEDSINSPWAPSRLQSIDQLCEYTCAWPSLGACSGVQEKVKTDLGSWTVVACNGFWRLRSSVELNWLAKGQFTTKKKCNGAEPRPIQKRD